MPVMDGYQTCEAFRNEPKTKDIPIVFLTGKDFDPDSVAKHSNELGVIDYIPKPSTTEELLDKIQAIFKNQHS